MSLLITVSYFYWSNIVEHQISKDFELSRLKKNKIRLEEVFL